MYDADRYEYYEKDENNRFYVDYCEFCGVGTILNSDPDDRNYVCKECSKELMYKDFYLESNTSKPTIDDQWQEEEQKLVEDSKFTWRRDINQYGYLLT